MTTMKEARKEARDDHIANLQLRRAEPPQPTLQERLQLRKKGLGGPAPELIHLPGKWLHWNSERRHGVRQTRCGMKFIVNRENTPSNMDGTNEAKRRWRMPHSRDIPRISHYEERGTCPRCLQHYQIQKTKQRRQRRHKDPQRPAHNHLERWAEVHLSESLQAAIEQQQKTPSPALICWILLGLQSQANLMQDPRRPHYAPEPETVLGRQKRLNLALEQGIPVVLTTTQEERDEIEHFLTDPEHNLRMDTFRAFPEVRGRQDLLDLHSHLMGWHLKHGLLTIAPPSEEVDAELKSNAFVRDLYAQAMRWLYDPKGLINWEDEKAQQARQEQQQEQQGEKATREPTASQG